MSADEERILRELAAIREELDELVCRVDQITSALGTPPIPERRVDPPVP